MSDNIADSVTAEIRIEESSYENEGSNAQKRKIVEVDSVEGDGPEAKKQKIDDQPAAQHGLYKKDNIEAPKYLPPLPVANVKKPILLGHYPNNSKKSNDIVNNSNIIHEDHIEQKENSQALLEQNSKISEDPISKKASEQHEGQNQPQNNNENNIEKETTAVNSKDHVEAKPDVQKENSAPIQNQPKPDVTQDSPEDIVKYLSMPIVSLKSVNLLLQKFLLVDPICYFSPTQLRLLK
jgi:hypothetical protein